MIPTRSRSLVMGTVLAAVLGIGAVLSLPARAEHFDITLNLQTSRGTAQSGWDTSPPEGGFKPREVVEARAGEEVLLEWKCASEFPHGNMKNVTIRIFVAPEAAIGQKALPPPTAPRVLDNSFTVDYLPKHLARGHVRFRVTEPGNYLVRLESEQTIKEHDHEHFGALDLKVVE